MEKVTVYGHVRPGRGERLPRVDFSESSRIDAPPSLETFPVHHDVPAPQQARRRSTRLLPNLRYLPAYDEDRHQEEITAVDDGIGPLRRKICRASVYEDLGAQQEQVQSRRSLISQNVRPENPSSSSNIFRGSSRKQSASPPRANTSTALSEKAAASRAVSRSYTMSTVMKQRPQKLHQKPSVATLPRPKHKKTLTGGRQIKTHLRCEHLLTGPVWGGGAPTAQQERRSNDNLTKRMAFERHRIARKIDALCAVSARRGTGSGMDDQGGYFMGKGKRGREVEEEESPPADKTNKLVASGWQYKTHLDSKHPPDQRRLQARPVTDVTVEGHGGDGKFRDRQERLSFSDDGTSEDDECNELRRSGTKMRDMESNIKRSILNSNIKTPRRSFRNVREEADVFALSQQENSFKKCDCLHSRSSRYSCSDCVYCREDAYYSHRSRCNLCPDGDCSHISRHEVGTAPLLDHRPNTVEELCPVCHRGSTFLRDRGRRRFSKGDYQDSCHFCGKVFGRSDLPMVSEDVDLPYGSRDHHNRSSRPDRRHCGDRPQFPGRAKQYGRQGGASAGRERNSLGASLEEERPQTSLGSEETSRRDREFNKVVGRSPMAAMRQFACV